MIAANSLGKPGPASWDLVGHGQIFHIKTSINCLPLRLVRSSPRILVIYYPWVTSSLGVTILFCSILYCTSLYRYRRRSLRAWKSEYLRLTSERKCSDLTMYSTCLRINPFFCGTGSMVMVSRTKVSWVGTEPDMTSRGGKGSDPVEGV